MSRALIIPDVHQELDFLRRIFAQENLDSFDRIVFLGDYFDGRSRTAIGPLAAQETAAFMLDLAESLGDRLTLLCGNHDAPYMQLRESSLQPRDAKREQIFGLRDLLNHSEAINRIWPCEFWQRIEVATEVDGWLLSHAGFHPDIWPAADTHGNALQQVVAEWRQLRVHQFYDETHPFLHAGAARGGTDPVGGPLWLDWEREFVDELSFPQIVGHSRGVVPRQTGRSWCIDCAQSGYALIEAGNLRLIELA